MSSDDPNYLAESIYYADNSVAVRIADINTEGELQVEGLEIDEGKLKFTDKRIENDPFSDLIFAHWTNLYILSRIDKQEMVDRLLKSFPDVEGNRMAELIEVVEEDKDKFWARIRNEKPIRDHSTADRVA